MTVVYGMVVRRRKKSRKLRGRSRSHGYGRIGQHRKSGSRGGFGAVGFGKHKWVTAIKYYGGYYGKHGFTRPLEIIPQVTPINVGTLYEIVNELIALNKLPMEDNKPVVNLVELGYSKLLGAGRALFPIKVITWLATERAVKKIREVGGEVLVLEGKVGG